MEIELPVTVVWIMTGLVTVLTILVGVVAWFLRREVTNNDQAPLELRGDTKKLLEGQGRMQGTLDTLVARRPNS